MGGLEFKTGGLMKPSGFKYHQIVLDENPGLLDGPLLIWLLLFPTMS